MQKKALESYLFIRSQINAIDKSKYIESEKVQRDLYFDDNGKPSQKFYLWWINEHADKYRKAWPKSLCKNCSQIMSCKDCLKKQCPQFEEGEVHCDAFRG